MIDKYYKNHLLVDHYLNGNFDKPSLNVSVPDRVEVYNLPAVYGPLAPL